MPVHGKGVRMHEHDIDAEIECAGARKQRRIDVLDDVGGKVDQAQIGENEEREDWE